jgi:L-fuconolactonase
VTGMDIIDSQIHSPRSDVVANMDFTPEQAHEAVMTAQRSPDLPRIELSADLAVAAMDAVGVRAAIIQMWRHEVEVFVRRHPDRFVGVPIAYMAGPQFAAGAVVAPEELEAIAATPGMVGFRLVLLSGRDTTPVEPYVEALRAGTYEAYLREAERLGLVVFIAAPRMAFALDEMVRDHPNVTFVLDHLGMQGYSPHTPRRPDSPDPFATIEDILALAKYPNFAVKLSAAPALSTEPYPFADIWPYVRRFIDTFGADRLMWGSDYTRCAGMHSYRESVDFIALNDDIDPADKEQILAGTIRSWLKLPSGM